LPPADLAFVDQLLGEGEVSVVLGDSYQARESVLAGVWRVRGTGERRGDRVDISAFPAGFIAAAFGRARGEVTIPERTFDGLFNAPALIAEINAHIPRDGHAHRSACHQPLAAAPYRGRSAVP
jgi:hydrogenase-1 operon protein HyaF